MHYSKTTIVIVASLFFSITTFSQINKGQWMIGGDAAFSYSQAKAYNKTIKVSTLRLSPGIGYFFFDRFAGGLRLDGSLISSRYGTTAKYRDMSAAIAPFLRYYFLPEAQKLNVFADAGYGFVFGKEKDINYPQYSTSYHAGIISFKAGPAVFLNEHTALEITAGYNYSTRGPIDTAVTNTIQVAMGLQIHFGKGGH